MSIVATDTMYAHVGDIPTSIRTPLGQKKVPLLVRCPDFRGCNVHKQGVWDGQMCPVSRYPHFRVS